MKRAMTSLAALCLAVCLALPAGALDYTIAAPDDPEYGDPTSVEPVVTADGGAAKNEDRSKNAALIPPAFGSPSAYALNTGTYLTPNLAPGGQSVTGAAVNGGSAVVVTPGTPLSPGSLLQRRSSGDPQDPRDRSVGPCISGNRQQDPGSRRGTFRGDQHLERKRGAGSPQPGRQRLLWRDPHAGHRGPDHPDHETGDPDVPRDLGGEDQRDGPERAGSLYGGQTDSVHLRPEPERLPLVHPGHVGVMDKLLYVVPAPSVFWSIAFHNPLAYHGAMDRRDCP